MKNILSNNIFWVTIFSSVLLCSCVSPKEKEYLYYSGTVFGTTFHITYSNPDNNDMNILIDKALSAVDNSLSMFNPGSTISTVNGNGNDFTINDSLFSKVFVRAMEISRLTDGRFDMTVAPLVNLWGFGLKNRAAVTAQMVDSVKQSVGWRTITLQNDILHKQNAGTALDAGAIAKGFACDVVADTLSVHGCTDYCVEIGGEIALSGVNVHGKPWRIGINKPVDDSLSINNTIQEIVVLSNGGMATSGNYRNFYIVDGKKYSHTIDPFSGYPTEHNLLSATIIAPDCMTADAWATACMCAGLEQAKRWLLAQPSLEGYLIYDENNEFKVWHTPDFPFDKHN